MERLVTKSVPLGEDVDDGAALLAAIIASPNDDTPRLLYADWLDERAGHSTLRAEFIRVQCTRERLADRSRDDKGVDRWE